MPTKRQILDLLTHDELAACADQHDLIVWDRRSKPQHVDALDARGPALAVVLADLPRERLKALCRALSLDDGGREKAPILARLVGSVNEQLALPIADEAPPKPGAAPPSRKSSVPPRPRGEHPPAVTESAPPSPRVFAGLSEITSFLWSVADLLRGDYKQADYGKVILPMTVLRRLDCVLADTKAAVLAEDEKLRGRGIKDPAPFLLKLTGVGFYNTSKLYFPRVKGDAGHVADNLRVYTEGFSPDARELFERFKFAEQIAKPEEPSCSTA